MMNENTNQEVTQENSEVAANTSPTENAFDTKEDKGFSFESVIYGEGEQKRGTPLEEPAQQAEAPEASAPIEGQPDTPYEAKNDEKRFEYWQSRASKLENQLKDAQPLVDYVKQNPQAIQQQAPAQAEPVEEFPPPPEKPRKPHNYSREMAYTDPGSDSARYEGEVEEWRDNMDEYNSLKVQYETAIVNEKLDAMETQRQRQYESQQARITRTEKMKEVGEYVQAEYGLSPEETGKFMNDMSDPSSVSMGNLVALWRMNNGKSAAPPVETPGLQGGAPQQRIGQPSEAFQQTQRAQQVPPPMGVQSGQASSNPDDGKTDGEKFMQALIGNHNDKQVF
jgi:hypothetical protein